MTKDYFSQDELKCKCGCGVNKFSTVTLARLNALREAVGHALIVSSAYRCQRHNTQIGATQTHATGHAVDILCSNKLAHKILTEATRLGFTGIGVSQKGVERFLHLDDLSENDGVPRPTVWSY